MKQTSREVVQRALTFNTPERVPVDLWVLPWAFIHHREETERLMADYPGDLIRLPHPCSKPAKIQGNAYAGEVFTDEWGCIFNNLQPGVIGEVKQPIIKDLSDWHKVQPPWEMIPMGEKRLNAINEVNDFCRHTDKFTMASCCPRPWERYQFLRGSESAMIDVMLREPGVDELLQLIHDFFCRELEFWAATDVDGLMIMDDWGSQKQLLIPPDIWREMFKPMYQDYCRIARQANKFVFMHSDGCITEIYPDLVEIGVSALNSQLFCMDMDELAQIAKGKITFWGELDRQHLLTDDNPESGRVAVRKVAEKLYSPTGGVLCQFEIGPGTNLATARAACEEWAKYGQKDYRYTIAKPHN